jgi:pimeloyl-ACP methyl ester carboxylesterase
LDYALHNPDKVSAPVMVDSAPSTLRLDVPEPEKFKWVAEAEKAGDLELVGELETQIWFDGDRDTRDIDQQMRKLAYDMNLIALRHDTKGLGSQRDNLEEPAVNRSGEIKIPVLTILGSNDIPYMHVALDFLKDHISGIQTATIQDAAHLPNLDQPEAFEKLLLKFIEGALT